WVADDEVRKPMREVQRELEGLARSGESPVPPAHPERFRTRVATAERQVNRLARLVESLLDISRITGGHLNVEGEPVDLAALAREALGRMSEKLERAGCSASLRLQGASHVGHRDPEPIRDTPHKL